MSEIFIIIGFTVNLVSLKVLKRKLEKRIKTFTYLKNIFQIEHQHLGLVNILLQSEIVKPFSCEIFHYLYLYLDQVYRNTAKENPEVKYKQIN